MRRIARQHKEMRATRMTLKEIIQESEERLAQSARLAREVGLELIQVSMCHECGFVAKGFYVGCGNDGHITANAEIPIADFLTATAIWN